MLSCDAHPTSKAAGANATKAIGDNVELTFSEACERNKEPILAVLQRHLRNTYSVFEVGSGTGQHAEHFARALPHLTWQCADLPANLPPLRARLDHAGLANTPPPLPFDMAAPIWPSGFDAVFSANTLHIMPWPLAAALVYQAGFHLPAGGLLLLYGPFKYNGRYTSASNIEFDSWLQANDPERGIRDMERVQEKALAGGLALIEDNTMPANNQLLVFSKLSGTG